MASRCPATYDPVTGTLTPTTPLGDGIASIHHDADRRGRQRKPRRGPATDGDTAARRRRPARRRCTNDNRQRGIHNRGAAAGSATTPGLTDRCVKVPATYGGRSLAARHADHATGRWRAFYHHADRRGRQRKSPKRGPPLTVDTAAPAAPAAPTSTAPGTNDNTRASHAGAAA